MSASPLVSGQAGRASQEKAEEPRDAEEIASVAGWWCCGSSQTVAVAAVVAVVEAAAEAVGTSDCTGVTGQSAGSLPASH